MQFSKGNESFLSRMHYIEYLTIVIRKHSLDTLSILRADDLETLVRRASIRLPPRPYGTLDLIYRDHLLKVLILFCARFFIFCFLVCSPQATLHWIFSGAHCQTQGWTHQYIWSDGRTARAKTQGIGSTCQGGQYNRWWIQDFMCQGVSILHFMNLPTNAHTIYMSPLKLQVASVVTSK